MSSSGSSEISDDGCSDWASSIGEPKETRSLFDDSIHPSVDAAIQHDTEVHGFNLRGLGLDIYERMRLINRIRKEKLSPEAAKALPRVTGDEWLIATIPDDPLLLDGDWEDDELAPAPGPSGEEIQALKALAVEPIEAKPRDDDTHYFESYANNDIHEIMLRDTTRTITYAKFILSNPVFKGATVLDVGCGTGILSLFAAKAGAKHVYAVEASDLVHKTRENIKKNGYDNITVIQGKVEDIDVPPVDIIISEWMGYMLLYESMFDSVINARDRFLKPGGLMAPSQIKLMVCGISAERIWKEKIDFWKVYGFDLSPMIDVYFSEGLTETVEPSEITTGDVVLKTIDCHTATPKSLDFHAPFALQGTVRAFLVYFDTYFSTDGTEAPFEVVEDVYGAVEADSQPSRSFTTGPRGKETHWKQVVFLLREPVDSPSGTFYCRKSPNNSRELDVEIHIGDKYHLYKVR